MKFTITLLIVAHLVGCESGPTVVFVSDLRVESTFDDSGGTVEGPRGIELRVPENAITQETTVAIEEAMEDFPPPKNLQLRSAIFALTPHGTTFSQPVTVRIPTPDSGAEEYAMVTSEPGESWIHVLPARAVDGYLEVEVTHFSFFAVVESSSLDVDASDTDLTEALFCGSEGQSCCSGAPSCAGDLVCEISACTAECDQEVCFIPECQSRCQEKLDNGLVCTSNDECASRFCVDQVCCESICGGQCEACSVSGLEGSCVPVVGEPIGDRPSCGENAYDPEYTPCGLQCDGVEPAACSPRPAGSICGSSCNGWAQATTGVLSVCDGIGSCIEGYPFSCAPYACNDGSCFPSCLSDMECAEGAVCDNSTTPGHCVVFSPHTQCSPDGTQGWRFTSPGHYISYDCFPYICDLAHHGCRDCCVGDHHCAPEHVCQPTSHICVYRG